jgi:tetratricopeptide (TPR) repeat protein
LGNHQKTIADFTDAIRLRPDHADTYYNRGMIRAELGNHLGAVENFTQATSSPMLHVRFRADVRYNRGMSQAKLGNHSRAVENFTEAIRLGPVHADMHYKRGVSRAELGNHSSAVEDFIEAIRLQPEHLDALQKQGISQAEMNKPGVIRLVTRIFPRTKPRD